MLTHRHATAYFPSRWHYGLVAVLVLSLLLGIGAANPNPSKAAGSWRGRVVGPVANYGAWGTIGTTQPNVPAGQGNRAFEFIMSYNVDGAGKQHFVQTGWVKNPTSCGSATTVFWEYYNGSTYTNGCGMYFPTGDNDYAVRYDPSNGYWCHDFNGNCIKSEHSSLPGLTTSYYLAAYGETNDPSVQMGGASQSTAIYLTNLRYFDTANNTQWITSTGASYGSCASPCPYGFNWGTAACVLYTYNWTY